MKYFVENKETGEVYEATNKQRLVLDVAQGLKINRELAKVKIELADINSPLKINETEYCWTEV